MKEQQEMKSFRVGRDLKDSGGQTEAAGLHGLSRRQKTLAEGTEKMEFGSGSCVVRR